MELSKNDIKVTKGVAILFMLLLHLFCRKEVKGLYETCILIKGTPLIYYLALFGDACVPIYCFASGYGLFISSNNEQKLYFNKNIMRIFKLLINYWIVLVGFVIIGFIVGMSDLFPGSLVKFLLNFFVLSSSYNGAWWFLQTYIILVLLSPLLVNLVKKHNSITLLIISGIVYLLSYIQGIKYVLDFGDNVILINFVNDIVLVGTSQLSFLAGLIFADKKIYSRLYSKFYNFKFKNLLCTISLAALIIIHSIFETMFIAPFTGIAFICLFNLIDKNNFTQGILLFFSKHSTNLWLTHMFFYMTMFPNLIFAPRYPVLIFLWLIVLCLISSYAINLVYIPIINMIDKKAIHIR